MKKSANKYSHPLVGIIMGSDSDLTIMKQAADICEDFGIPFEIKVLSAHRTPNDTAKYASSAYHRGLRIVIAGAGGAAHLPGVVASYTSLPVIGVPIESKTLKGIDSLLSIVQMPAGVPVATVGINNGRNAGLLAAKILAISNSTLQAQVLKFKANLAIESRQKNQRIKKIMLKSRCRS